jgi:hypothetical protein
MSEPADADVLVLVSRLLDQVSDLSKNLSGLAKLVQSKASRKLVIALMLSVVFDVILSVVIGLSLVGQAHQSNAFHNAEVAQCRINNTEKANDIKLWIGVLQNKQIYADYLRLSALVYIRDVPQDCVAVYK